MKQESGFTIVEMMVVILIMSVLAGIAITGYLNMRPSLRLSGASRRIAGELMAARMKAISQNNNFKISLRTQEYDILDDDNSDGTYDEVEGETKETKNIQDMYLGVSFITTVDITYTPRGTATPQTITLENSSGSKSITVSIAGRVKIN